MQRQRSSSIALARERPRLAPPLLILALTLGVAAVLVLLFPREDLVVRLSNSPEGPLSAAYLRALLRTDPDNPRLRLLVANNLLRNGRLAELRETLEPALASADPAVQREALWLLWLAANQAPQAEQAEARQRQRRAELKRLGLSLLVVEPSPERLAQVAGSLLALGEQERAMTVFRQLEAQAPGTLLAQLEQAATQALARADHAAAAEIHLVARRQAADPDARRTYFLAAMRDLESGNRVADALALAERELAELADDRAVLLELVRLARAAGRPDVAERYVRRLLRMSLRNQLTRLALGVEVSLLRVTANAVPVTFDDAVYSLAYTVFLENRNLQDAYRVAASAVRQAPDNLTWRRRLAQVAEWLQRPDEALDQWLVIARAANDRQAWEAVRRLAVGLLRDDAYEAYLRQRLARGFDTALALELASAQERQGRPEAALRTLSEAWQRARDARLARAAAELAERLGELGEAVSWWQRWLPDPPGAAEALHLATLYVLLGERDAARALLARAATDADAPSAFWRFQAQLASQSGDAATALAALSRLAPRADAAAADLDALEWLLAERAPPEAARIALLRWHRFGDTEALLRALARYQEAARFDEARTVIKGLDATARARLEDNARWCLLAARQAWQERDHREAARLYARAGLLASDDGEVAEARLWFAIERQDIATVREIFARHERSLLSRPDVRIAARTALGDIEGAWRIASGQLAAHRNDPLWLMLAADLLDELDRPDEAWQVRRHALRRLPREGDPDARLMVARARLAASLAPGDRELAALRQALAADTGEATPLLLSHWIRQGEYSAARAWIYGRLAKNVLRPRWAELAIALAEDDRDKLAALLEHPDGLPRRDAVEAARRLDGALAASAAAEAQSRLPHDDDLHEQLAPLLRAGGDRLGVGVERLRFPAFSETRVSTEAQLALTPRLKLSLELSSVERSLRDAAALGTVIDEHGLTVGVEGGDAEKRWRLRVGSRQGLAATTPVHALWQRQRGTTLWSAEAGRALPADESTALRMAGQKNMLALALTVEPLRPLRLSMRLSESRYAAQTGTALGRGRQLTFHATTGLRGEDPDLTLDLFVGRHRFSPVTGISDTRLTPLLPPGATGFDSRFFLPEDFTLRGLTLSSRTTYLEAPSRALRPFWALSLTHHSVEGFGYDALLGVSGSLAGGDQGVAGLQWTRAQGTAPGTTRRFFFHYRFDF
jgi:hypothetical protein